MLALANVVFYVMAPGSLDCVFSFHWRRLSLVGGAIEARDFDFVFILESDSDFGLEFDFGLFGRRLATNSCEKETLERPSTKQRAGPTRMVLSFAHFAQIRPGAGATNLE